MLLPHLSVILCITCSVYGANILAILPTPSYSHQIAYTALWRELSLRGHKVTLITTDPLNDPKLTNLTEIDMKWSYGFLKGISKMVEEGGMSQWSFYTAVRNITRIVSRGQLAHHSIQDLIHDKEKKFDLVLSEFLYPEFLAFAEIHKCPKILFASLDATVYFHKAMGNSLNPVLYPEMALPFHRPRNFKERVFSTLYFWYSIYYYNYKMLPDKDDNIRNYFQIDTKTKDIINDIDLLLLNVNPVINNVRAIGPATINIGDLRRSAVDHPLTEDLIEFLDDAKEGFVYFSFGSNVKSRELHQKSIENILQALSEVPYKVLWKYEEDHLPGKPDNVKIVKWAPQRAVLAHPNIKLFVTQGGLQSMEEGIFYEVPFVVVPFFADQDQNADLMRQKGIAKVVERLPHIEKQFLKQAILEVIKNPSYKNTVRRLKQLAIDTPMTGMETGIWWIEYVIRNKGAKHLRNPAADIPFYQYYLLDVIGFLIAVSTGTLTLLFILVRRILDLLKPFVNHNPLLKNKKLQ